MADVLLYTPAGSGWRLGVGIAVFVFTTIQAFLTIFLILMRRTHFPLNTPARANKLAVIVCLAVFMQLPITEITGPDIVPCWLLFLCREASFPLWGSLIILYAYNYLRQAQLQHCAANPPFNSAQKNRAALIERRYYTSTRHYLAIFLVVMFVVSLVTLPVILFAPDYQPWRNSYNCLANDKVTSSAYCFLTAAQFVQAVWIVAKFNKLLRADAFGIRTEYTFATVQIFLCLVPVSVIQSYDLFMNDGHIADKFDYYNTAYVITLGFSQILIFLWPALRTFRSLRRRLSYHHSYLKKHTSRSSSSISPIESRSTSSIIAVLAAPKGRKLFSEYLRMEFCIELLLFWSDVKNFKEKFDVRDHLDEEMFRSPSSPSVVQRQVKVQVNQTNSINTQINIINVRGGVAPVSVHAAANTAPSSPSLRERSISVESQTNSSSNNNSIGGDTQTLSIGGQSISSTMLSLTPSASNNPTHNINIMRASHIIDKYIKDDSPMCINVSDICRKEIYSEVSSGLPSLTLFDNAQAEVLKLMEDPFNRFTKTVMYSQYAADAAV